MADSTSSDGYSEPLVNGDASEWKRIGDGIDRQILSYGPDLMLVRVRFAKGAVGAIHHHPHRQATYVVSGSFEAAVGDSQRTLRAGDSFFAAADVPHGVRALEDGMLVDCFTPARADFLEASER
jgi:quercetin dioxygenase-like cupin family protein